MIWVFSLFYSLNLRNDMICGLIQTNSPNTMDAFSELHDNQLLFSFFSDRKQKMKIPKQQLENKPKEMDRQGENDLEKIETLTSSLSLESTANLEDRSEGGGHNDEDEKTEHKSEKEDPAKELEEREEKEPREDGNQQNNLPSVAKYSKYSKSGNKKHSLKGSDFVKGKEEAVVEGKKSSPYIRTRKPKDRGRIYPVKYPEFGQKREKAISIMAKYSKYMKHVTSIPDEYKLKRKDRDGGKQRSGDQETTTVATTSEIADETNPTVDDGDLKTAEIIESSSKSEKANFLKMDFELIGAETTSRFVERRSRTALGAVGEHGKHLSEQDRLQLPSGHHQRTHGAADVPDRRMEGQRSQSRMSDGQQVKKMQKSSKVMYVGSVPKFMKRRKEDPVDNPKLPPPSTAVEGGGGAHETLLPQFRAYSNTYPRFKGNSFLRDRSTKHNDSDFPDWRTSQGGRMQETTLRAQVDNLPALTSNLRISEENNNTVTIPCGLESEGIKSTGDRMELTRDGDHTSVVSECISYSHIIREVCLCY